MAEHKGFGVAGPVEMFLGWDMEVLIPQWASRTTEKREVSYSLSVVSGIVGLLEPWVPDMSHTLWQG